MMVDVYVYIVIYMYIIYTLSCRNFTYLEGIDGIYRYDLPMLNSLYAMVQMAYFVQWW